MVTKAPTGVPGEVADPPLGPVIENTPALQTV